MFLSLSAESTLKRAGTVLVSMLAVLAIASPAAAAVTPQQKATTLAGFTQTSATSYNTWNSARQNQDAWAEYGFDWSTDYCSSSPDNPLGFDFTLSCYRHDFGTGTTRRPARSPRTRAGSTPRSTRT